MHFRALCPSVMLATLHSGVLPPPFVSGAAGEPAAASRKRRRRWSWLSLREPDEDESEAPSDSSEEGGKDQKENRPPRTTKPTPNKASGTSPIEVKRPALAAPNGLRRSPCMGFSPFARGGIRYACSSPPPARRASSPVRSPSPPTPPPSPLASPPDAPTHAMVTVAGSTQSQRAMGASAAGPRPLRRDHALGGKRRGSALPLVKSPLTMNPNQRFSLVCLNDRFYWVSKEVESSP